ncbi:MAG: hypothetical protein IOC54_00830 [Methylobacterium sp.]|nr:hypothetical protein [Methylobacterium sp.]MCA3650363.1 hypothetical protein [Methylobacterium sp.]MCA4923106.1 hypothetical protein [Methylobacterium sp.]
MKAESPGQAMPLPVAQPLLMHRRQIPSTCIENDVPIGCRSMRAAGEEMGLSFVERGTILVRP